MSVPMIAAGVGLLVVCCSSSMAALAMGGEEKEDPVVPKTPAKKKDDDSEDTTPSMLKCINTQKRGDMGWVFKARVKTEAEARALCPDSEYMSLECPTADGFEVFCVDDISQAGVLTDKECKGDVAGTALHGGANAHCVGPYKWGDVHGGGANRGSLYKI
jgi:hypothetical protein